MSSSKGSSVVNLDDCVFGQQLQVLRVFIYKGSTESRQGPGVLL